MWDVERHHYHQQRHAHDRGATQSQTVVQGANATFSVVATGTGTLNYQWRFNGTNLAGRVPAATPG